MELNINVNVKFGLDRDAQHLALLTLRAMSRSEHRAETTLVTETPKSIPAEEPKAAPKRAKKAKAEEPVKDEKPAEPSDLPFDDGTDGAATDTPAEPVKVTWSEDDARAATRAAHERVEAGLEEGQREKVHKESVKIMKQYLKSAAYKHERDAMGNPITKDGQLVKKIGDLDSDERLRFIYLCESMMYDADSGHAVPFDIDSITTKLDDCGNWDEVERGLVKTYKK